MLQGAQAWAGGGGAVGADREASVREPAPRVERTWTDSSHAGTEW